MPSFDIGTLLDFKPPKYFCEKCKGLLLAAPINWKEYKVVCPICHVEYQPTEEIPFYNAGYYLESNGYAINFENPIEQGRKLAAIAYNFNKNNPDYPPTRALFESISTASKFIHFTTYGLSRTLYGALKLKAQSIPIRGIASNIHPDFAKEIQETGIEAPRLELILFEQGTSSGYRDSIPHQKLLVIDGLMAFKGAANMTDSGWRKAARGRDYIEVMTNVQEIKDLHNKLFSPIWAEKNNIESPIQMSEIPF